MAVIRSLVVIMGLSGLVLGGCSKQPVSRGHASSAEPVLKIAVYADGRLTVDGKAATIEMLRSLLQRLSEEHGVVWYYREAGQQKPPPIAMEVMQAVVEARLPVRLSSRADYSDAIGTDGTPSAQ
jgi:hypothetical protein